MKTDIHETCDRKCAEIGELRVREATLEAELATAKKVCEVLADVARGYKKLPNEMTVGIHSVARSVAIKWAQAKAEGE